jgi:23S rRNA (uracil1939-C5)-methyltransferase
VADGGRELPEPVRKTRRHRRRPPRAGLTGSTPVLRSGGAEDVYVSCNPATMGPNVSRLRDYGYRLERITPVDMFPHTPHVECVGVLALR